jgi:hypothetical protein
MRRYGARTGTTRFGPVQDRAELVHVEVVDVAHAALVLCAAVGHPVADAEPLRRADRQVRHHGKSQPRYDRRRVAPEGESRP